MSADQRDQPASRLAARRRPLARLGYVVLSRGSSASRSESPNRLEAKTAALIARPGAMRQPRRAFDGIAAGAA